MTDVAPEQNASTRGQGFDALAGMGTPDAGGGSQGGTHIARTYEQKLDAHGRAYATGKRKNAIAKVWLKPGSGRITIKGGAAGKTRDQAEYFARPVLRMMIAQPLNLTDRATQFDVIATVEGSGLSGQAGAIRHAISKALTYYEPGLRPVLKPHGFLTRDSRVVERKKYGRAKARRSFQFSKR